MIEDQNQSLYFVFTGVRITEVVLCLLFHFSKGEPYVELLGRKCSWTLTVPGNGSGSAVALMAESTDALAEQICQDLGCGNVYNLSESSSPPHAPCWEGCSYQDGRLQNCSQHVGSNCTVINKVVCGEF